MLKSVGLVFCTVRGWSMQKILSSGGRRWWGCTATQQIAGKDSSLHFIIIEYNSQSRAGTKPPLQVKCLRRFTIWRGGLLPARAASQNFFTRFARFARLTVLYRFVFVFQYIIPAALPPRFHATTLFFFTLTFTFCSKNFFKTFFQKQFPSKSIFIKEIRSVSALISRDTHFHYYYYYYYHHYYHHHHHHHCYYH